MKCIHKLLLASSLVIGLVACSHNISSIKTPTNNTPKVEYAEDSDPAPEWLVAHIIKRTNQFCEEAGRARVIEIVIDHSIEKRHTNVIYVCLGEEVESVEQVASSDYPVRINEDVLQDGEVHMYSVRAAILTVLGKL